MFVSRSDEICLRSIQRDKTVTGANAMSASVAGTAKASPLLRTNLSSPGPARDRFVRSKGDALAVPATDADIAFAPVTVLSRWIERKQISSERLTNIYLRRIEQFESKL